ncbi:putative transporter SVOPL isoform X12 [Dreissena polymorpha]|nr:putative transporter SVOPL isoform X12 [Dreissena polymorpha]
MVKSRVRYSKVDGSSPDFQDELESVALIKENSDDEVAIYKQRTSGLAKTTFTAEEGVEAIGFGLFQIRLYIICGLFTAADSLEMMLLAVLSPVLRCEWQLEQFQVAFITTVVFIGMCIMAPVWGFMGDKYGRQTTLYMVAIWIGYFGLLTSFSPSYKWILILRGLVGGGMAGSPQAFTLLTEYLPSKYRAKLLNVTGISWAFGTMFEIVLASVVIPTLGWRWLMVLSAIPSFLILILLKFLPESARYLVAAGREYEAQVVLEKAAKLNRNSLPAGTITNPPSQSKQGSPRDLFSRTYCVTTLMVWILWFGTALSYYGMVLASAEILQIKNANQSGEKCKCNLLKKDDYTSMIVSTLGEFIALPLNIFLIDLVGRRWTGAVNLFGCGLFFILLQLPVPMTVLTGFIFLVRGFSAGMFNFVYIYTSEVYPTTIRTLGIGAASSWARVGAMVTPFLAQVLLDTSLTAAVWVYGSIGFICAVCAVLLPIETKGRELPWLTLVVFSPIKSEL